MKDKASVYENSDEAKKKGCVVVAWRWGQENGQCIGARTVKAVKDYVHTSCQGRYWMVRLDGKSLAVGNFWKDRASRICLLGYRY